MLVIERLVPPAPPAEATERLEAKRAKARERHGKDFAADRGSRFERNRVSFLTRHFAEQHWPEEKR